MLPVMAIGDQIRAARIRLGMTQRALATQIGVDKSAVAQWEGGGGGKGIRTQNLIEVARVLQIKPSELLGEDTAADTMNLTDQREMTVVTLYRHLTESLRVIHLQLLYSHAGMVPGQPAKQKRRPRNSKRMAS
jgi:transcriptional regulator with XRE-family HTH domain